MKSDGLSLESRANLDEGKIKKVAQHRHLLAIQYPANEFDTLIHNVTLLPRHLAFPPQRAKSVTHVSGIKCDPSLGKVSIDQAYEFEPALLRPMVPVRDLFKQENEQNCAAFSRYCGQSEVHPTWHLLIHARDLPPLKFAQSKP